MDLAFYWEWWYRNNCIARSNMVSVLIKSWSPVWQMKLIIGEVNRNEETLNLLMSNSSNILPLWNGNKLLFRINLVVRNSDTSDLKINRKMKFIVMRHVFHGYWGTEITVQLEIIGTGKLSESEAVLSVLRSWMSSALPVLPSQVLSQCQITVSAFFVLLMYQL